LTTSFTACALSDLHIICYGWLMLSTDSREFTARQSTTRS